MYAAFTNLGTPVLISLVTVLPFMVLEIVNRQNLPETFPFFLFGFLWIAMLLFILILRPLLKTFKNGLLRVEPLHLIKRVTLLLVIGYFWINILADQMPCFLGVINCD